MQNHLQLVVKLLQVRLQNFIKDHSLKTETLCGHTLTEIHELLQEGCSDSKLHESLTLRRLMSYIYGAPILDISRSHTTTQHSR